MQLVDILKLKCIKVPLEASEKYQAITELMQLLKQENLLRDYEVALKAVMEREAVRSTGVGQGFAIPHGKCSGVEELTMAVGKTRKPIDFDSIDKQLVTIVVLLISPVHQTGLHIQALARISRIMTNHQARKAIDLSNKPEEIYELIKKHEKETFV